MNASDDSPDADAEVFRAFGLACRSERDRIAHAEMAEQDRRFESAGAERAIAVQFAARVIAMISRS